MQVSVVVAPLVPASCLLLTGDTGSLENFVSSRHRIFSSRALIDRKYFDRGLDHAERFLIVFHLKFELWVTGGMQFTIAHQACF